MLSGLKERAEKIKQTRVNAEMIIYESKVDHFLKFDVEQELLKNKEEVVKDIAGARKTWSVTSVVALGIAAVTLGPALAVPAVVALGTATFFLAPESQIFDDLRLVFKNADKENESRIKTQLKKMEYAIKETVNDKITLSDYFKAVKESIKVVYQSAIEKKDVNYQYQNSVSKILAKRDEMRMKLNGTIPVGTTLKM